MPIVAIAVDRLNQLIGREFKIDELVNELEQLGCDVEDTAELAQYECPVCKTPNEKLDREEAPKRCDFCGHEQEAPFERLRSDTVIRMDLLADRPDLFDAGGMARALKGHLGIESGLPDFSTRPGTWQVKIDPDVKKQNSYRPHIVCAVVTLPPLDQTTLKEIMKLQENLHWGIGRDRKLASIGVYDLDTISFPVRYTTVDPDHFSFIPLGMPDRSMTPRQILESHPKGVAYAHLLDSLKRYPLLIDNENRVLSMPPIINSDLTRCKLGTSRLFIDVTGLTRTAVTHSLSTLIAALSVLGGKIEEVTLIEGDEKRITPDMSPKSIDVSFSGARKWLGLPFDREEFKTTLNKMRFSVEPTDDDRYRVSYPTYRMDVRHEVDIFEDLAIGYGYERIEPRLIPSMTVGQERPEELISNRARTVMTGLGYTEVMSLNLQSLERHFEKMLIEPNNRHVVVANPKTIEQKVLRTHLMTGLLETLSKNKRRPMPMRLFEIGNIVILDSDTETGVNESRHIGAMLIGPDIGYAEARSALDSLLFELGFKGEYRPAVHPSFIEGRLAEIDSPTCWAHAGEIHPQVIGNFGLTFPVAYLEMRLMRIV